MVPCRSGAEGSPHGLAIAYELAKRGITKVAILEKSYIGAGGSGRNTTIIRAYYRTPEGVAFLADGVPIRSPLRGSFNVENCLAAFATARSLGVDDLVVAEAISSVRGVPGRGETVEAGQGFLVMVDYAHTPASVENVLRAARSLAKDRVIAVVGCGGDRDRAKRPGMGFAATANADLAIITSDNPRSEDPLAIIAEITPGAERGAKERGARFVVEPDRGQLVELSGLVEQGRLRPAIDSVFPLPDAARAFDRVMAPGKRGKVVLEVRP